jgi:hypothetical protein
MVLSYQQEAMIKVVTKNDGLSPQGQALIPQKEKA